MAFISLPTSAHGAPAIEINGTSPGKKFDGIGVVNGGGATSVLLKDYPEPQRSQILDLMYKPKFGASVSALIVEIPGDGNSTQGSMPSHMHTRDDLNYQRGYTWWILREAKRRNPRLSLDATAWSAPGWVGNGDFWSQDAADYYVKWLQGLRTVHGLELDAIGCRNEKGFSIPFAKALRRTLDAGGFADVRLHAFDEWIDHKFDFVRELQNDPEAREAIDIISGHILWERQPASAEVQAMADAMGKPIWNTEEHIYRKGFDCAISIVKAFNDNYIRSRATKVVNWYDIAGVYPMEPYSEDPAAVLAWWPWSGHFRIREALWGYAHWGQFTEIGWQFLNAGCGALEGGGTYVTLKSPDTGDYSVIVETKGATTPQQLTFKVGPGLSTEELCVWRSNASEQFVEQPKIKVADGFFVVTLEPNTIYSLSTTRGQQKGSFQNVPAPAAFPLPYRETFESYTDPKAYGFLPRYTADIYGVFELVDRPDGGGKCVRQTMPTSAISWAPAWLPYTIVGDQDWKDYEINADVRLNAGDTAGIMGRVNHVGTGFGVIPKGYYLSLRDNGECKLTVVRGKIDKRVPVGDAEQQRIIAAGKDEGDGGEKELASVKLDGIAPNQWHQLRLTFEATAITGYVDGKKVLSVTDALYEHGMAGLVVGTSDARVSTPFFDNLEIKAVAAPTPEPTHAAPNVSPIYAGSRTEAR